MPVDVECRITEVAMEALDLANASEHPPLDLALRSFLAEGACCNDVCIECNERDVGSFDIERKTIM